MSRKTVRRPQRSRTLQLEKIPRASVLGAAIIIDVINNPLDDTKQAVYLSITDNKNPIVDIIIVIVIVIVTIVRYRSLRYYKYTHTQDPHRTTVLRGARAR